MTVNIPESNLPRVVIVGAGFAGLQLARTLGKEAAQVVIIDRHNYHTFQPLLYQVATSGLEPDSIAYPIRNIFPSKSGVLFRMAHAQSIDVERKTLHTNIGSIPYDQLIIATGSATNFFGMEDVARDAMPMKTIPEALNLRSLVLQSFESALLTSDLQERERLMNFVIVGGGPTGVELAGALAELKTHILPADYPDLDIRRMNIHLIEAGDRVLSPMSEEASAKAEQFLQNLGVKVWLKTQVTGYDGHTVETNLDKSLPAETLIWAAGVKGTPIPGLDSKVVNRANRILVDEFNRVKGYESIYAAGDVAAMSTEEFPNGHPMMAQAAMQQGQLLGKNLKRQFAGKAPIPFQYKDKGSMATVGRNLAVVDLPQFKFQGFFAWFVWMFIHLISLVGFRNRLIVLMNWGWSYFRFDKGIRLIIRPFNRVSAHQESEEVSVSD